MIRQFDRAIGRLRYSKVVRNLFGAPNSWPKALIHYKTSPLYSKSLVNEYAHTNNWEIVEMCRIVAGLGFAVDVVDRSEAEWLPPDEYALFIGNGAGNSGYRFPELAERISGLKVLYAAGPETRLADRLVLDRYDALRERTGVDAAPMRVMDRVDIGRSLETADSVLCLDSNRFSADSWAARIAPVFSLFPSTSPALRFDPDWLSVRDRRSFLCFAGDGFIAKGVDLVVEAFATLPEHRVHIAGPDNDRGFWEAYGDVVERAPNIHFEGFLDISKRRFSELCAQCSWVILPAAAEGVCTSVATAMRCGLVPVTTFETGIDTGDFGYQLPSEVGSLPSEIRDAVTALGDIDPAEYRERAFETLRSSSRYNQASFTVSFTNALTDALAEHRSQSSDAGR